MRPFSQKSLATTIVNTSEFRLVSDAQCEAQRLGRQQFLQQFSHPWLVRELEPDERDVLVYHTGSAPTEALPIALPTDSSFLRRLRAEPNHFALHSLIKTERNPWLDRILIGRAQNNDIVLRAEYVSKLHAYLEEHDGSWWIHDADSANGTWLGETRIGQTGPGLRLVGGVTVRFGRVPCLLLTSHDLLDFWRIE